MTVIDRTRTLSISAALLGSFVLGACSDSAGEDSLPVVTAGTGAAGAGAAGVGAAGTSAAGAGAAGAGGVGTGTAGTGAAGVGAAGAAGMAAAGSGAAGSDAAGSDAAGAGAGGEPDAGAAGSDARPSAVSMMLPTTMESPMVEPWFNVYRPTDLAATGQPLPVIAWANGGCFRSDFTWAPLFERWAAGGFVVLALTEGPDGPLVQSTVADQKGLIDWALAQAESGPYAGMLDTDRIIAAGNSCGGITALGLAADDERVAAVFVLSGSSAVGSADLTAINAITVPVGYIVGGSDDIAGANATSDYDALGEGIPAMIVSRSSGDHITVSTDTMVLPYVAEISLNWMDLAVYGTAEAAEALNSPNVCASCKAGEWSLKSKNLETLQQ